MGVVKYLRFVCLLRSDVPPVKVSGALFRCNLGLVLSPVLVVPDLVQGCGMEWAAFARVGLGVGALWL